MKDLRSEVYNALIEIMMNNPEATKEDMDNAIEWFQVHAYDEEENNMTKVELVSRCYADVVKEISDAFIEDRAPHTSEIIRDWKCCAAEEWEDLTVEEADKEFNRLYNIVDKTMSEKAMIYA